jgi:hypothetical protein
MNPYNIVLVGLHLINDFVNTKRIQNYAKFEKRQLSVKSTLTLIGTIWNFKILDIPLHHQKIIFGNMR